MTVPGKQNLE